MDKNATVGTIHILSNIVSYFVGSENALFSCASINSKYYGGSASMHELAHSIGRIKDEYEDVSDSVNTSETGNLETIQWKKLLGFGGVGITLNGYHAEKYYIPTPYCNMLTLENSNFCEVCKLHIARRLNSTMFTQKPD